MKPSRNAPCPCGSGRKFKHCCGAGQAAAPAALEQAEALLAAGLPLQAEAGYRAALVAAPDSAPALEGLGRMQGQMGRHDEAAQSFGRLVRAAPKSPRAHHLLGQALLAAGRAAAAVDPLERALALGFPPAEAHYALAEAHHAAGHLEQAVRHYRRTSELVPDLEDAHYNRAIALQKLGRTGEAVAAYREVLRLQPDSLDALINLGELLSGAGDWEAALPCFERAVAAHPGFAPARRRAVRALIHLGRHDQAVQACRQALAAFPGDWQLRQELGTALLEAGCTAEAGTCYREAMALRRRPGRTDADDLSLRKATRAKLRHDIEQLEYLRREGHLGTEAEPWIGALRQTLAAAPGEAGKAALFDLDAWNKGPLAACYNRLLWSYCPEALPSGALNPHLDFAAVEEDYFRNGPGITWVDGLLAPQALAELRRMCLESTIWFDFGYGGGYVGAMMEEGFCSPLLLQIADRLCRAMPRVFKQHRLLQMWAYKYDSELSGIPRHADFAAVNVNFWIAPDEANLDPDSGGLVVWDKEAPLDWDFEAYNRRQDLIEGFLQESGAGAVTVPHRQNRAIIFNSDLFHKTDDIRFRPGYENRRINITMLFGRRGEDGSG